MPSKTVEVVRACFVQWERHRAGSFFLCSSARWERSTVDLTTMTNANHNDSLRIVFDAYNDAVVANPVAPKLAKLGATKGRACAAGILKRCYAFLQEAQDTLGYWPVQLV